MRGTYARELQDIPEPVPGTIVQGPAFDEPLPTRSRSRGSGPEYHFGTSDMVSIRSTQRDGERRETDRTRDTGQRTVRSQGRRLGGPRGANPADRGAVGRREAQSRGGDPTRRGVASPKTPEPVVGSQA